MSISGDGLDWLGRAIGVPARDLTVTRLRGSTSSTVYLVCCGPETATRRFVLRVLDNPEWLAAEPDLVEHEAAALLEAGAAGLRAPRLVARELEDVGFGWPVLLMTFLDGRVVLRPPEMGTWLEGLAVEAAAIHGHGAPGFPWRYRSWVRRDALAPPPWTEAPEAWAQAIDVYLAGAPRAGHVFIHRDYHPTNVLWVRHLASGVVDWINACTGPAAVDVAHCRTNLALMYGAATAARFLGAYRAAAGTYHHDPYWDLDSILDACLPEPAMYAPWTEYGFTPLSPAVLRRRIDEHLDQVLTLA